MWLKKAPQPWEDNKLNWTKKTNKTETSYRHTDFFYSSDILLKNVLTVGISERQRCMSGGVRRCSLNDRLLKWWLSSWKNDFLLKNMMVAHTNNHTQRHLFIFFSLCILTLLSPPSVLHLWPWHIYCLITCPLYDLSLKNMYTVACTVYPLCKRLEVFLHVQEWFGFHGDKPACEWNRAYIRTNQTHEVCGKVKGFLYRQLTWVLLNVKAVKLLLNVMFYTLLSRSISVQIGLDVLWHLFLQKLEPNFEYINQVFKRRIF